jgi:glycosyltransferase involved in cell wall biosynthesis
MRKPATLNVVFMAHLGYPRGMAGTQLLQNLMDALQAEASVTPRMLVLRQGRDFAADNPTSGVHKGIEYYTAGAGLRPGLSSVFGLSGYIREGLGLLRRWQKPDAKNILFVYGPPSGDNLVFILRARRMGYRVVFYLVEDIRVQGHAKDFFARLKHASAVFLTRRIGRLADAVLVISRRLQDQIEPLVGGRCPVRILPICVNLDQFPVSDRPFGSPVRLLYGGTFGDKDNVEILLEAFGTLCSRGRDLRLALTGRGSPERMEAVRRQAEAMACRDRIDWLGYLEAGEYVRRLGEFDILCMTRGSSAFAQAGFPFKLGEYLATGRPLVASRVSDVTEYLTDRRDAVLIEPDSAADIVQAVEWLLDHPAEARQIGRAGRQTAERCFDARRQAGALVELLDTL